MSKKELKEEELEKASGGYLGLEDIQTGDWIEPSSCGSSYGIGGDYQVLYQVEKIEQGKAYLGIYDIQMRNTSFKFNVYYTPSEEVTNNPVDIRNLSRWNKLTYVPYMPNSPLYIVHPGNIFTIELDSYDGYDGYSGIRF